MTDITLEASSEENIVILNRILVATLSSEKQQILHSPAH